MVEKREEEETLEDEGIERDREREREREIPLGLSSTVRLFLSVARFLGSFCVSHRCLSAILIIFLNEPRPTLEAGGFGNWPRCVR